MNVFIIIIFILILIIFFLLYKIILINYKMKDIIKQLKQKKFETNNLITTNTKNKYINDFIINLNKELTIIHNKEIEYSNNNQELYKMVTNISHDLRTPLTVVIGYIDLLKKNNNPKYLDIIDNKLEEITNLTEQLLDYSKWFDTKETINKENICLNDVLEETIISFYNMISKNNIELKINISNKKIYINNNKIILTRIFENIIYNAIKYSDHNLEIELKENGTIYFKNKTSQIDKISINKIFDRYFTVENAKKSNGVGLSIAKELVELSNGIIEAYFLNKYLVIKIIFK